MHGNMNVKFIINCLTCCGQSQTPKWMIIMRVVEEVIKVVWLLRVLTHLI